MNRLSETLTLLTLFYTAGTMALPPLVTRCEMDYDMTQGGFFVEGGRGDGEIHCWDGTGNGYSLPVHVDMLGGGAKVGICHVTGHMSSLGVGFSLNDFLTVAGKVELGPMVAGGCSVGPGATVNVAGLSVSGTLSQTCYNRGCAGIVDGEALHIWTEHEWLPYQGSPPPRGARYHPKCTNYYVQEGFTGSSNTETKCSFDAHSAHVTPGYAPPGYYPGATD